MKCVYKTWLTLSFTRSLSSCTVQHETKTLCIKHPSVDLGWQILSEWYQIAISTISSIREHDTLVKCRFNRSSGCIYMPQRQAEQ